MTTNKKLPPGWEWKKLGEVCEFVRGPFGGSLKKSCFKLNGYAVYEQQHAIYNQFNDIRYFIDDNKFNEMKRFELKSGDLIMSCSGTMGKTAIVPVGIKKGIINQALLKLSPKSNLFVNFLKTWMNSIEFQEQLALYTQGAAIKNVASVKILKEINIPLPPLTEQKRLVAILDKAFEAINKAKENTEKNLVNANELFDSYLDWIFSKPEKDWEEKKLGEVCKFVRGPFGGSLKKSIFKSSGYAIYEQQHAIYNQFDGIRYFIDKNKYNEMIRFKVNPGDLIMSCSGTMGRTAIVPENIQAGIINQALLKLTPQRQLSVYYLERWMKSQCFQKQLIQNSQGAAIQNVASVKVLKNIKIVLPPPKEQEIIINRINVFSKEIQSIQSVYTKKITALDEFRQSILEKVFQGDLIYQILM